ncbi:MAG: Sulfite exporter TauE/SafE [Candidatus Methanoperedens nitroreducens]|uniref:Probable membrane transporter protein n=1 Tax=Candidatus Methanoperedens nitratireducens TaxID=1392998 RepID=A0A0P8AEA6_9EURY|nr:sulfite exporter TauE/SafE family protein [Candidatus Methanoperedens sp. BLZ2]KAB2945765.1 MAG: sulfite exporter TauE/SafE family protein [Candidatus Methanoperedens sp.]KPQ42558.1 MAG: Sulfite exporter TauE/SafE [Candidatus Methanoperedens sp. BLZ1]MBZ0174278.1 sulfite exporter TauE/SafE family protein [Candidatus Methanoperedens nitroreducens]MCX9077329.1 sulfite exporter TauE/SafE family protein [Candidatus Methanoperedens sp.]
MDFTFWYLFPVGIIISILSMSAGISGANFWIPVYIFFIKIDPLVSFWLALITMLFGFGSGVTRNIYQGTINWYIVRQYLIPSVPAAVIGSLMSSYVNGNHLIFIFSSFIFIFGMYQLIVSITSRKEQPKHQRIYRELGFAGGFLKGLIATGLGKLIMPGMWDHERIKSPSQVIGSTIVILFIVDFVAAITRMNPDFVNKLFENRTVLINALIFVVPSVVIGGQVGPRIIRNTNANRLKIYISVMLIFVSLLIFSRLA